jgi:amino acid transporter
MVPRSVLRHSDGWLNLAFANDFGPLAALALIGGLGWLAYLLYFDAVVSPINTGLIYTTVTSRVSYAVGRNGNGPGWLARNNKHGVPHLSLLLSFLVSIVLLLPFPSWQQLVGFITSATVLTFGTGPLALVVFRRTLPDRHRPFRLPGGHIVPFLAFYCTNMIMYWAGWQTNSKLLIAVLIGYVFFALYGILGHRRQMPRLDFGHGFFWIIPWLIMFGLVSWLFDPAEPVIKGGFFWVFLINLGVSLLIYVIAINSALPTARLKQYVDAVEEESRIDDESHTEEPTITASGRFDAGRGG